MSVILAGTVRFALDKRDGSRPRMEEMMRLSRAEDGCIQYVYSQDLIEPGLVHVYEVWRDEAALHAHHTAPHFDTWKQIRSWIGMSDRKLFRYDVAGVKEA